MRSFTIMFIEIAEKPSIFSFLFLRKREKWESNIFIMSFQWKHESNIFIMSFPWKRFYFLIPVKTGIQFFIYNFSILSLLFKCLYFVIPVKTGIQYFPLFLSFPWKRETSFLSVISLFCHSRENGNPLFLLVI